MATEEAPMHAKLLLATVVVVLTGCAGSRLPTRANTLRPETQPYVLSSVAVPVTVGAPIRVEYTGRDGPEDMDYVYSEYWPDGLLKHRVWVNGGIAGRSWYDRRGRCRSSEGRVMMKVIADLSHIGPAEFAEELEFMLMSPDLRAVYIVGNREIRDEQVLELFAEPQIKWMIVERCRKVSRATMRAIKSKLVRNWPKG
jgi:hypothetical protein